MKVVINICYGGFGLSDQALLMLKERGWVIEDSRSSILGCRYFLNDDRSENDLFRSHKDLVEVVEELGESADGPCSRLKMVEIPDGTNFEISDYDGIEEIHEVHRKWS